MKSFVPVALAAVALSAGMLLWFRSVGVQPQSDVRGGLPPGRPAPPIEAAGWLGGEAPAEGELDGKVLVVQGWFTTCPHCRRETPELVQIYKEFRDQGVEFISLTFEGPGKLPAIQRFHEETGILWRNGYGAARTLDGFEAEYYPCLWVIGRDGVVLWNRGSREPLEQALQRALDA